MSDFQCPYCRRFARGDLPDARPGVHRDRQGPLGVRQLPAGEHSRERGAGGARSRLCAGKQGAFWAVHDLLYKHQEAWAPLKEAGPFFLSRSPTPRRSTSRRCSPASRRPRRMAEIQADAEGSERSGAQSTPTFYIEGGLLAGRTRCPCSGRCSIPSTRRKPKPRSRPSHRSAKNTSYSAWVQAVTPNPRVRYRALKTRPARVRNVNDGSSSRSPYGPI